LGIWLGETFHQELKRVPTLTLVDRQILSDITRELQLGKSEFIDRATSPQNGKGVGADSLLAGTYKVDGDNVELAARITDVETGIERVAAQVNGSLKNLGKLQVQLAKKLIEEIHGAPLNLEAFIDRNIEAFHAFSDGVYFLRNDLPQDALREFDRALAIDRTYFEAQFYRGLALKKLQRWDEAIAAFRRTLPRSTPERRVTWSWEAPFVETSKHGKIIGIDGSLVRGGLAAAQKRILFGERKQNSTLMFLPNLEKRRAQTLEIADKNIGFPDLGFAADRYTVLLSADREKQPAEKLNLYAISAADNRLLWHKDLPAFNGQLPLFGLAPDSFYSYMPATGRLTMFDDRTREERWTSDVPNLDKLNTPILAANLMIVKTGSGYRALRMSDGGDAWTVPAKTLSTSELTNDRVLVVFDHNERFRAVDIATGRILVDMAIPPSAVALNIAPFGTRVVAQAVLQGNQLYVVSKAAELLAVDLDKGIRWKTPLPKKVSSLRVGAGVYAGTETGELMVIDRDSGAITATTELAARAVSVDHAANDLVIASADAAIFGLDPSGKKLWVYPSTVPSTGAFYFKGVVVARTSSTQITTLDAKTGELLWQHTGQPTDGIHLTSNGFFVVEEAGIKEYAIDIAPPEDRRPSDKEVLTELAGALMAKGNNAGARTYIEKVRAIDPDYPPLRWLLGEFAAYADLVGRDTRQGQQAIAELKRKNGLVWSATMDGIVVGAPVMIGERVVNVGRLAAPGAGIVALDKSNGQTAWRQFSERVIDSVADDTGRFWYVSGQAADPSGLILYRLNVESGERQELARWSRPFPLNAVYISYALNRVFVAALSMDFQSSALHLGVDRFDAASGARLWKNSHDVTIAPTEIRAPIGIFTPLGENLVYSAGHEIWAVNGADGTVVDQRHEVRSIGPNPRRTTLPEGPLYYVTDNGQIVAYDVARKQVTRSPRPEMKTPQTLVRDGILYSFDDASAYAFDVKGGQKWRLRGKFRSIVDDDTGLWALREDNVVQRLDRLTGKVLSQHPTLWRPGGFKIIGNRFYAFTSDGLAYCLELIS
jgi:outer membrane protein assembly factor BamB/TolB-like protein